MNILILIYRKIFCKKLFYTLNLRIFNLTLRGIGILNYEGYQASGESWFLNTYLKHKNIKTIVDVGANSDPYGIEITGVRVFALEPNPYTFRKLQRNTKKYSHIHCFPLGLSDKSGKALLYDLSKKGTGLATLQKGTLEKSYGLKSTSTQIALSTLDEFVKNNNIKNIDLLKIDTEGSEYKVLLGAKRTLEKGKVKIVLFEFNEMNAYGRVFLRDFYNILKNFTFYRLLPDGLVPLGKYRPITHELFAFQNIVAVNNQAYRDNDR